MRTFGPTAVQAMMAQETGEVFLLLLRLTHQDLPGGPLRAVNDMPTLAAPSIVSRGDTYFKIPFDITFPADTDEAPPEVRLSIDDITRDIVRGVRQLPISPPMEAELELVLASDPDVVEGIALEFSLRNVSYQGLTVSGQLSFDDDLNEGFPAFSYTPNHFLALT